MAYEIRFLGLYRTKDTFDDILIPMCDMLELEPVVMTGRVWLWRAVDEKDRVVNLIFLRSSERTSRKLRLYSSKGVKSRAGR